jgi:MFS family permease
MPEILSSQMLSRGNGLLESLSFIAIILGTVCGGMLSFLFQRREVVIGLILLGLALVGALASLLIETMPAANPHRPFPRNVYGPLANSLGTLIDSRPLRLAAIGIAFFTFVVAFMRATVYLLGESQNPRWNEFQTSVVVGMSALGIGLGAPLAGFLSGRKVELGLVPIGAVGMVLGGVAGAVVLAKLTGPAMVAGLVACIILVGFSTGFYLVPMYTLLQHRAPKTSKGDAVATSNFINVTGAILASAVAAGVVFVAHQTGVTPKVANHVEVARGTLARTVYDQHGRPQYVEIREAADGRERISKLGTLPPDAESEEALEEGLAPSRPRATMLKFQSGVADGLGVAASRYEVRGVVYYLLRPVDKELPDAYDEEPLPRYLFLGAALVSLLILLVLLQQMPDLLPRAFWVLRSLRQARLHVVGTYHLPTDGPTVLVTNCQTEADRRNVVAATDRLVRFVAPDLSDAELQHAMQSGAVLALAADAVGRLSSLQVRLAATYLPVYHGPALAQKNGSVAPAGPPRVAFGPPLPPNASPPEVENAIRQAGAMTEEEH